MRKIIILLFLAMCLVSLAKASYTPPSALNVTLTLKASYSVPNATNVTLILDEPASNAPFIQNITITPSPAYTNSQLNCSANYGDTESDKGNVSIAWYNSSTQYSTATILNVVTGQMVSNATLSGIQAKNEIWNCTINATDSAGNAGAPNSTTITISNLAPSVPEIGGPSNATRTIGNSQILRCANSTDIDGDTINYVFYGGTSVNPTSVLQNSTSTTYAYSTTDGSAYYWRCKAEDGAGGVSAFTAQKTFTENSLPSAVDLVYPANGASTTNRTPQLNWSQATDADGDSITYQINISRYSAGSYYSSDSRLFNSSSANQNWTNVSSRLKFFWDDLYYYNWTVRAWDGYEFSAWNDMPYTMKIASLVSLNMLNASVNFSTLGMGATQNTSTNEPFPLSIRNNGNCFVSINMSNESELLWNTQQLPSEYYRYKIDNLTAQEGSFDWGDSITAWTNIPTGNNTVISYMNYTDTMNSAEIDILVTVPPQEPAGLKSSRLVFTGWYVREV